MRYAEFISNVTTGLKTKIFGMTENQAITLSCCTTHPVVFVTDEPTQDLISKATYTKGIMTSFTS